MDFEIPATPDNGLDDYIVAQTRKYNAQFVPDDYAPLSVYCRNSDGSLVGGLTAKTYWNYLDIEFLWVDEKNRKSGLAAKIMSLAEEEATRRGCLYSMLDTYEFQALDFYLKQGYEQFGQLDKYCNKYERYYLKKKL